MNTLYSNRRVLVTPSDYSVLHLVLPCEASPPSGTSSTGFSTSSGSSLTSIPISPSPASSFPTFQALLSFSPQNDPNFPQNERTETEREALSCSWRVKFLPGEARREGEKTGEKPSFLWKVKRKTAPVGQPSRLGLSNLFSQINEILR